MGGKCRLAGWGAINLDPYNPTFEPGLKELKIKPVMKSNKCTLRTFFHHSYPGGKVWWRYQLVKLFRTIYQFRRKFQFCVDVIKKGSLEGPGKVKCTNREKSGLLSFVFDLGGFWRTFIM